jgi:hypothetical protein
MFAQIYRETLPYCEQRWDIGLRYAGSFMVHTMKVCGLEPKLDQIYYTAYLHFASVCNVKTR